MKKTVLLSIALIIAGFLSAPAQNIITMQERLHRPNANFEYPDFEKPQSPSIKKSDSGQGWWEPDTLHFFIYASGVYEKIDWLYRNIYKYCSQGLLEESVGQRWENDSWEISYQIKYTYDSNNNLLSMLRQIWTDNSWINSYKYTYTYDSNNNLLIRLRQNWENNSWVNSSSIIYSYDSNKNLQTTLEQTWGNNNSWVNGFSYTYTYDSNNNILTELRQEYGSLLYINTYDSNNNKLSTLRQIWQNNSWVNYYLYTNTYDSSNNRLTELIQGWNNNSWVNSSSVNYCYDFNNNLLSMLQQNWQNNSWVNFTENRMIYDENNNSLLSECWWWVNETWQPSLNGYIPGINLWLYYNNMQSVFELRGCDKMTASYIKMSDMPTAIEPVLTPEINDISIYPNPTTGELRIKNYELGIDNVEVFDIYGIKQLAIFNFQFSTQIDISHLPAGIYFVRITTEKGVVTKKIMKK